MYWTYLHQISGSVELVVIINLTFVLRSPKRRFYGTQLILGTKIEHGLTPPSFSVLAFYNDVEYRHLNAHVNTGDNPAVSCKNLVKCGSVNHMAHLCTFVPVLCENRPVCFHFIALALQNVLDD